MGKGSGQEARQRHHGARSAAADELRLGKQTAELNHQLRQMGPFLMFPRLPANFTLKSTYTRVGNLHALDFSAGLVTDAWMSGLRAVPAGQARHAV